MFSLQLTDSLGIAYSGGTGLPEISACDGMLQFLCAIENDHPGAHSNLSSSLSTYIFQLYSPRGNVLLFSHMQVLTSYAS
jgi:hypothetical protein